MAKAREDLNPFEIAKKQIDRVGKRLGLNPDLIELFKTPKRELTVNFPVKMDDGRLKVFTGYRVQFNDALGPFKGGIRYHWNVSIDEVRALACWSARACPDGTPPRSASSSARRRTSPPRTCIRTARRWRGSWTRSR